MSERLASSNTSWLPGWVTNLIFFNLFYYFLTGGHSPVKFHVGEAGVEQHQLVAGLGGGVLDAVQQRVVVGLPRHRRGGKRLDGGKGQHGGVTWTEKRNNAKIWKMIVRVLKILFFFEGLYF